MKDSEKFNDEPAYRAPALEKGIDVLELLSQEERPLTVSMIVQRLGRSTGELFRMIQVLERRGLIAQQSDNDGYVLTSRLFELGIRRPQVRNVVEIALPVMRRIALTARQSCHLGVRSGGDFVVVARMESAELYGYSVRIGYRRPIPRATSGKMLFAFQPADVQARWIDSFAPALSPRELSAFIATSNEIRARGSARFPSGYVAGVTDISAPIMRGDRAAAALSVPFMHWYENDFSPEQVEVMLVEAADEISAGLIASDARV